MNKIYVDITKPKYNNIAAGFYVRDHEVIPCGTVIQHMDADKNSDKYVDFKQYDIRFIMDDYMPEVPFYTVPYSELIAKDSKGGWFGIIGENVCYFSSKLECFQVAENTDKFIADAENWRKHLTFRSDVKVFQNKAEAEKTIGFTDLDIDPPMDK